MTNLEGLRLLSATGMAKFLAEERLKVLTWLCEDEAFRLLLEEVGYIPDTKEMREKLEEKLYNWLGNEMEG